MSIPLGQFSQILPYPYKQKMLMNRRRMDKPELRRSNAFSYRSLNSGCDVGKPKLNSVNIWDSHVKQSADLFKILYDRDMLPFQKLHLSNRNQTCKLAWFFPITEIWPSTYLPLFIRGLLSHQLYLRQMAYAAVLDIVQHSTPHDIAVAIPSCISPFRFILRSRNGRVIAQGLDIIKEMATRGNSIADELTRFIKHLFHDVPYFSMKVRDGCEENLPSYSDHQLYHLYMETMKVLEQNCSPSLMGEVVNELRFVAPTYEAYDDDLRVPSRLMSMNRRSLRHFNKL